MYCRNCGNEVSEKAVMCVACGTPPLAENKFCYNCKNTTSPNASICLQCGVSLNNNSNKTEDAKDWLTTLILCVFLGFFGVHRFYTKHTSIGVIQLLTGGGCGIWAIIDFVQIVTENFKDADGQKLIKK